MYSSPFTELLLAWFAQHGRTLPWRQTKHPYPIWLSEVILQQTRVAQGLPYYLKFLETFPTVDTLANAQEQEVLRLWQGLGYYSRARNLHQTAKQVVETFGGVFPDSYAGLLKLKGVGPYTAAAIASFAYDEPVAVLDGNVYRVLARVFGITTDITHASAPKIFGTLAQQLLATKQPAAYNQAIMDFGATQCVPVSPVCMFCVMNPFCYAFAHGGQAILPVKSKKAKVKTRYFHYFVVEQNGRFLMRERTSADIWAGLYEWFLVETPSANLIEDDFIGTILEFQTNQSEVITHLLTHRRIEARGYKISLPSSIRISPPEGYTFYDDEAVEALPKSVLVSKIWEALNGDS